MTDIDEILAPFFKKRSPWFRFRIWLRWSIWDPRNLYRAVKRFYQRGRRGFSDEDVWNLDTYLAGVIGGAMLRLSETAQGYPPHCADFNEWKSKLVIMAQVFRQYSEGGMDAEITPGDWDAFGKMFDHLWD